MPDDRSIFPGPGGMPAGAFGLAAEPEYRPRWWLHWLLFGLTLFFTTACGGMLGWVPEANIDVSSLTLWMILLDPSYWIEGLKFSLPLMTILLCHEMGHYAACRAHGLAATPPFFIPLPIGIGTLGAVIRIKEPIRRKTQLLDIGAAGPIAGFIALVPFMFAGLAWSEPSASTMEGGLWLGEPLVYRLIAAVVAPEVPEGMTLVIHPTGFAAWVGVLITLLNMLPMAQLDGGHITYAMFGSFHRRAVWPMLGLLFGLGFIWHGWWVWAAIVVFLRVEHPPIGDEHIPLDRRRTVVGWIALAIFVLCFMLEPIALVP